MALPLDGYVRVSRVGARSKEEGFISPEQQEEKILAWANARGIEVVMQPHELDVSGGTMDRPVFNECMARVKRGDSGGIIVFKSDRFARTLLGAITTLGELGKSKASFVSATEPELDYSTPAGRAFMQMLFVFAEFLRSTLKEAWRNAAIDAVQRRGIHVAPYGAFGYDKGADKVFVPNTQAPIVRRAFELRGVDGWTWTAIAEWLNEAAPHADGKMWTGQAVQRMLARRVYLGEAFYGVVSNTEDQPAALNRTAHPALVDEDLWSRAQMDPGLRSGGTSRGQTESGALLGGIIRCAGCRYTMTKGTARGSYPVYRCRGRHTGGKCPSPSTVSSERIEQFVISHVADLIEGYVHEGTHDSSDVRSAGVAVAEARAQLEGFRQDRKARKTLGAETWNEWLEDYVAELTKAERELRDVLDRQVNGFSALTAEEFLALPFDRQRAAIRTAVDAVFLRRLPGRGRNAAPIAARAHIFWRGDAPDDLPRARVYGGPIRSLDWPGDEGKPRMLAA